MKRTIYIFIPVFFITLIIFCSIAPTVAMSESISNKVFRLHILANSDEKADQDLKLKVRDEILNKTNYLFNSCNNVNDAIKVAKDNIGEYKSIAQNVINDNGYNYDVFVEVSKAFFDTREYESFTLPAGVYDALRIVIGEGKGHNWWCVMFPSVCISGSTKDFDKVLSEKEKQMILDKKYVFKFKSVEIYERIKNQISS